MKNNFKQEIIHLFIFSEHMKPLFFFQERAQWNWPTFSEYNSNNMLIASFFLWERK